MGLKLIVPPLQGSGSVCGLLTQAFSLGFVISPLQGLKAGLCEVAFRLGALLSRPFGA